MIPIWPYRHRLISCQKYWLLTVETQRLCSRIAELTHFRLWEAITRDWDIVACRSLCQKVGFSMNRSWKITIFRFWHWEWIARDWEIIDSLKACQTVGPEILNHKLKLLNFFELSENVWFHERILIYDKKPPPDLLTLVRTSLIILNYYDWTYAIFSFFG